MSISGTPITVVGNLTDDPELRFTPAGVAVARFSVAVNRRVFDKASNAWQDQGADYHRVTAWRSLAEGVAETLVKGMRVIVTGTIQQQHWTDEKTQEKRSAWTVTAEAAGPDLTFATAKVSKSGRARMDAAPGDPWASASRTAPVGVGAAAPAGGGTDESPF
jgi:single-strand DNA-binding protein